MSPWSIVCNHLMSGESREWRGVESNDNSEVEFDWLCPDCLKVHLETEEQQRPYTEEELDSLKCVCIHCVCVLRRQFDPNFTEEPE